MSTLRRGGGVALWAAAVLGALSLLLGLATVATGVQPLIVQSASMQPAISTGSLAVARTIDSVDVRTGDVVSVVDTDGRRVTHRVIDVDEVDGQAALTLQGDANDIPDAKAYLVDEVDRVLFDVPRLGYVASWASGPAGMVVAGLIGAALLASFVLRPRPRRAHAAAMVAVVVGCGAVVGSGPAVVSTDAYFNDAATFEAGTIAAHEIQAFAWGANPCVKVGSNLRLSYRVKDPRYTMVWDRYPQSGGSPTRIKQVTPSGAVGSDVTTDFTPAELSAGLALNATYRLVGSSKLKGAATSEWLSATKREMFFTVSGLGGVSTVTCGTVNVGPTVVFTAPTDGTTYANPNAADAALTAACGGKAAPCGTAADQHGIKSIEYRLQRINGFGTYCRNPDSVFGYSLFNCGTWRPASTSPALPTTNSAPVTWTIPVGSHDNIVAQSGSYTLFIRTTDNAGTTATTESTISFRIN